MKEPQLIIELRAGAGLNDNPNLRNAWGEELLAAWDALRASPGEAEGKVIAHFQKYAAIAREKGATHMSISCDDFESLLSRSEEK